MRPEIEEEFEAPKAVVEETVDAATPFIPPAAEVPEIVSRPMPSIDDLPPMIQRELAQLRNKEEHEYHEDDNRPKSLLKRWLLSALVVVKTNLKLIIITKLHRHPLIISHSSIVPISRLCQA